MDTSGISPEPSSEGIEETSEDPAGKYKLGYSSGRRVGSSEELFLPGGLAPLCKYYVVCPPNRRKD